MRMNKLKEKSQSEKFRLKQKRECCSYDEKNASVGTIGIFFMLIFDQRFFSKSTDIKFLSRKPLKGFELHPKLFLKLALIMLILLNKIFNILHPTRRIRKRKKLLSLN